VLLSASVIWPNQAMARFGKFFMTDEIDREEWEAAWGARIDRTLPNGCKLDLSHSAGSLDKPVRVTIAVDPPQFAERVWRGAQICPVCGESTLNLPRTGASLDVGYESGFGCFIGVWVHQACLDCCPVIGAAAHIPW